MALDSYGHIWTWGNNTYGQLGCSGSISVPTQLSLENIVKISAGYNYSLALDNTGCLYSWGINDRGQLATNSTDNQTVPYNTGVYLTDIDAGFYHVIGIDSNGVVYGWGDNSYGQLGCDSNDPVLFPVEINIEDIQAASAGYNYTLLLSDNGEVYSAGINDYGQLGNGSLQNSNSFQRISISNIKSISAGYNHSLACDNDGKIYAWGNNNNSQIGDGSVEQRNTPSQVLKLKNVKTISAGYAHAMAIDDSGNTWSWGYNNHGQLGIQNSELHQSIPSEIDIPVDIVSIDCGYYHNLAVDSNGEVWSWGYNNHGQLGLGDTNDRNVPTKIAGISNVISVSAGNYHSLALTADGTIWSWGYNNRGQLGVNDKTVNTSLNPQKIESVTGIVGISAGNYHSLAVKNDGTVWAWGYNNHGQLGLGNLSNYYSPQKIDSMKLKLFNTFDSNTRFKIQAGHNHSVALSSNGDVYAWGYNNYGQLGLNNNIQMLTPTKIDNLTQVKFISSQFNSTLTISNSSSLTSWGYNNHSQLGEGTTVNKTSPTLGLIGDISELSTGAYFGIALKNNGTVWSWGYNDACQLGDGRNIYMVKPYLVNGEINDIHGNDIDNAHLIDNNSTNSASINYEYDEDYFVFYASTTGIYQISSESSLDLYGYVYGEDKKQIAFNDDGTDIYGNAAMDFKVTINCTKGNKYYIRVGCNTTNTGSYLLHIYPDDYPNTILSEQVQPQNELFQISGEISHRKDSDIFAFKPPYSREYIFTNTGDANVSCNIYNAAGDKLSIENSNNNDVSFRLAIFLLEDEMYYIEICPRNLTSTGDYELNVEIPFQLLSIE